MASLATLKKLLAEEDGTDSVEYSLVAALIFTAMVAGAAAFSSSVNNLFIFLVGHISSNMPVG